MEKELQFKQIFALHYPKVVRLCTGYFNGDADFANDAAQEIFMRVWQHLDSFRGEAQLSTWIYRISVNTCLMFIRKQKNRKETVTGNHELIADAIRPGEEDEKLQKMYSCIRKLDEINRLVILMVLEGIDYPEIAGVMGMSEENIRVRIHRIKKSLTQCVQL
ncbi:MAG: sigma-70 family RNA polymerase sigma factor [Chitinophagaceae bacterium]|nr:MAG: sigma-70 family RNA polymerase sigma factor [Chitinophagaceae bacterium]